MITEIVVQVAHTEKPLQPHEIANLFTDLAVGYGYGLDSLSEWSEGRINACNVTTKYDRTSP